MASLQDLIRNQPHLWVEACVTANGIRDDGGIIFAEDPRFGEWLRASSLTIYQASMLENHAFNTIRVGSTFANAIRDGTAFCGIPRAQLPPSVVTGLIKAATAPTQPHLACQNCNERWENEIFWFWDCHAHNDPEHRAYALCDIQETTDCCDVTSIFDGERYAVAQGVTVLGLDDSAAPESQGNLDSGPQVRSLNNDDDDDSSDPDDPTDPFWKLTPQEQGRLQ